MIILIALSLAMFTLGAGALWLLLPARIRKPEHIDYRQRWEDAIGLLGEQGKLTEEQVARIKSTTVISVKPRKTANQNTKAASLRTLYTMASWDRAAIEVTRARKGLPPVDDLRNMASWDKKKVLEARANSIIEDLESQ